jgi:multicomponent Na+:H+ antiporter subunit G
MNAALEVVAAAAILVGGGFGLLAALGLLRFPDLYTRIHAASKAGVVSAGFVLFGLAIVSSDLSIVFRSAIGVAFLLITTPISAHLLARTTYLSGGRTAEVTKTNELQD